MIEIKLTPTQIGRITNIYKSYIVTSLKNKIQTQIARNGSRAERIAFDFLTTHFLKNGKVSEDRIIEYLLSNDPEKFILSFWECVSSVWCREFHVAEKHDFAKRLSKWNGAKHESLKNLEMHKSNASDPAKNIIDTETQIFFARFPATGSKVKPLTNADLTAKSRLEKVTFDLYEDIGKVYAPSKSQRDLTYGALDMLEAIFQYSLFNGTPRAKLLDAMGITVCPYCNRQYITHMSTATGEINTGDIDHFYYKSLYPYLALSVYNFIPSCQICNSRFKHTQDCYYSPHVNPHKHGFGSRAMFRVADIDQLMNETAWNIPGRSLLEINITKNPAGHDPKEATEEAIRNSVETFHLNDVYRSHYDYAREIVWKSKIYPDQMIATLQDEFDSLFDSEKDVIDLIFGQYLDPTDACKRPLAKLTQDLLKDSGTWVIPQKSSK